MQHEPKFGCGKWTLVGPLKGSVRLGYKRALCNSYRCSFCRPKKLKRTRARIAQIATEQKLQRFASLTLDPSRIPRGMRSDRYLRKCWHKMQTVLARRFGASVQFIGVLEFHKSGVAHLHVLLGHYIPQDWLSEAWQSIGGGEIVDIRIVDVHRVAGYLACYLAGNKVEHTMSLLPRRARIFSCSRSIVFWGKKAKSGWWLCKKHIEYLHGRAVAVEREKWESLEDVSPCAEELTFFVAPPMQEIVNGPGVLEVLRALLQARDSF